jgi:peptidyl-dipeptidase Dcp
MKRNIYFILVAGLLIGSCGEKKTEKKTEAMNKNPFLTTWNTPYGVPPFDKITTDDYQPAFEQGIKEHNKEIEAIVNEQEKPTFENTIAAIDKSGQLLDRVSNVFFNLLESNADEAMHDLAEKIMPMVTKHGDNITFNEGLFKRIKAVYEQRDHLNLTTEQMTLLVKKYESYVRNGVNLNKEDKDKLRKINEELSMLTLKFGKNVLEETNKFEMVLESKDDLEGLPKGVIDAAAEAAKDKGYEGKWLFGISKPSLIPFLQYSTKRDLRKKMLKAYTMKGDHNDVLDNKSNVNTIVNLRLQKAKLLGFDSWADYRLSNNMAKNAKNVYKLMDEVWNAALPVAKKERTELTKMLQRDIPGATLQPWDWWYYAEKLRSEKYALDEEQMRPYFKLENVIEKGIFYTANQLYGLHFEETTKLPKYHPDVKTYEVKDTDGSVIAILYMDFFPRESKRGGAWMTSFRKERKIDGKRIIPIISIVTNFTKPTKDTPSLLSMDEVETIFHEFGHALHGMLSQCTYNTLSGTAVFRDFVELPSQIMENWATEEQVMKHYALHYQTGETIPDELIDKIAKTSHFNQGFTTIEFLSAAYLDMDWHTQTEGKEFDVNMFEKESMNKIGLIPEIIVRYRSTYYNHVFSGGYSAGYYSYVWAEVLDADAYAHFKENGIFNKEIATSFRKNILEKGGSEDPMVLYKRFRGQAPEVKHLIERRGLQ